MIYIHICYVDVSRFLLKSNAISAIFPSFPYYQNIKKATTESALGTSTQDNNIIDSIFIIHNIVSFRFLFIFNCIFSDDLSDMFDLHNRVMELQK